MTYLEATPSTVTQQNGRLWMLYDAEQRAARGLKPGDSLDTRGGVPLPLAQAITNGSNGYVLPVVSDDGAIAAIPLDAYAITKDGQGGVDLRTAKDEGALDARIRSKLALDGPTGTSALEASPK